MASAVDDEIKRKRSKKVSHSKDLLFPQEKPDLVSKLKELGHCRKTKERPIGPPKTFRVTGSSVLSRVKDFLPQLEQADQELKLLLRDERAKPELDIENTKEGRPCIELNMAVVPVDEERLSEVEDSSGSSCSSSGEEEEEEEEEQEKLMFLPLKVAGKKHKKPVFIEEVDHMSHV